MSNMRKKTYIGVGIVLVIIILLHGMDRLTGK